MLVARPLAEARLRQALASFPATVLLGARQVGKTTLARTIASQGQRPFLYLDLERAADRRAISEPETFLAATADRLVVLDEIHRAPGLFPELRGIIDDRRRHQRAVQRIGDDSGERGLLCHYGRLYAE